MRGPMFDDQMADLLEGHWQLFVNGIDKVLVIQIPVFHAILCPQCFDKVSCMAWSFQSSLEPPVTVSDEASLWGNYDVVVLVEDHRN